MLFFIGQGTITLFSYQWNNILHQKQIKAFCWCRHRLKCIHSSTDSGLTPKSLCCSYLVVLLSVLRSSFMSKANLSFKHKILRKWRPACAVKVYPSEVHRSKLMHGTFQSIVMEYIEIHHTNYCRCFQIPDSSCPSELFCFINYLLQICLLNNWNMKDKHYKRN